MCIRDSDNTSTSIITKKFFAQRQKKNEVISVTEDLPKSFVLYCENGKTVIYLSQFSTVTLKKRIYTNNLEQ